MPDDDSAAVLEGRRPLRIAASRSRPPAFVSALAERGDVELVPMGSAGVKVLAVADGTVDAYVHGGGQYEWDSAAPVAVARSRGLVCTRLDGSELEYNRENPWLPDLFVCPRHWLRACVSCSAPSVSRPWSGQIARKVLEE
nr:hypothetical protein GCM10025730_41100 [Promicromonospora thailandica]